MNSSNSTSVICLLVSSNFSASSPAEYLGCGFSALAALRTISDTTLGCKPFDIMVLDFSKNLLSFLQKEKYLYFVVSAAAVVVVVLLSSWEYAYH